MKLGGCVWGERGICRDNCMWRMEDDREKGCLSTDGCAYDSHKDHCSPHDSYFIGLNKCEDPKDWHDDAGDGCDWYNVNADSRCFSYGHRHRNFGKVADEVCCACKFGVEANNRRRRELANEEGTRKAGAQQKKMLASGVTASYEEIPKRGFLFHGGVLNGIEREIITHGDYLKTTMVDSVFFNQVSKDVCEEVKWWSSDNEMVCPEGQSVGTLFQSGLNDGDLPVYSLEKGYCCTIPVTRECVWKEVSKYDLGAIACEQDFVVTGFRLPADKIKFDDIEAMKCCRLD